MNEAPQKRIERIEGQLLLEAEALRKAFGGQIVLNDVCLQLKRGEVVLLRGPNGSGKTTLLNILTGNLAPDAGKLRLFTNGVEESFHFPRRWWENLNVWDHFTPERLAVEGVGRTWQDIRLFYTQTLQDNIAVAITNQVGESPTNLFLLHSSVRNQEKEVLRRSAEVLTQLGLEERSQSSGDKVSLGQAKRVAIARALQAGVRILFLDEPLAGLDEHGVTEVMNLLQELVATGQVTLVIVEHVLQMPRIAGLATTVWSLEGGHLTVESPHKALKGPSGTPSCDHLTWVREVVSTEGGPEEQILPGGARFITFGRAGEKILEVSDLVVHRGSRLVIGQGRPDDAPKGINFTLRKGQLAVLQAPNGWGKTTLFEAVVGLIPVTRGEIRLQGKPLNMLPPWERVRLGISFLQAQNNTFPTLTVAESLGLSAAAPVPAPLSNLLNRCVGDLSGGEKQKVAIFCALAKPRSPLTLLDEPFSALDADSLGSLRDLLRSQREECTLIAIPGGMPQ